jgi:hypothetical protein
LFAKTKETLRVCHSLLSDPTLYHLLLKFDRDLAAKARAAGCSCGGSLHSADYARKPRGIPAGVVGQDFKRRLSLCCARDGCRRRTTPASVRFLGRRVYLGAVVVLATAMTGGITAKRAEKLHELVGVSLRTLRRWRAWWRVAFAESSFWKAARGRFSPPVETRALPASLLERFSGSDERDRLIRMLVFLGPLTTTSAPAGAGS